MKKRSSSRNLTQLLALYARSVWVQPEFRARSAGRQPGILANADLKAGATSTAGLETGAQRVWLLTLVAASVLAVAACGYHVEGRGAALPPDVKTIAVPIFKNETPQFKVEQNLTSAVVEEFIDRTRFRITTNPVGADAVLHGTVKQMRSEVITYNPQTGSATTMQIELVTVVSLVDQHTKKLIFSNPSYVFREQYQIAQQTPSILIQEDPAAISRLSQDFARTLVTDILENF
jgi:outer membrane lipopolysaccharide assembly protein LptE/RlpB